MDFESQKPTIEIQSYVFVVFISYWKEHINRMIVETIEMAL